MYELPTKSAASPHRIRCGIVGFGKVGRIRAKIVAASPRWDLRAVADPARPQDAPPGIKVFADYKELLQEPLDAVFVCTPNHVTADVVVAALDAGAHVFCEKPPGRDLSDVDRIVAAEAKHPTRFLKFGFNHRYHDAVIEAKKIVDGGQLGQVLWMRGIYGKSGADGSLTSWRSRRETAGGGILLDQGIHMVDLFRYFAGDFEEVKSVVQTAMWPIDVEDNAFAIFRNARRQVALLHSSSTHWRHRFSLEIFLTGGYVSIQGINTSTRSYGRETLLVARNHLNGDAVQLGQPREEVRYFERDDSWIREVEEFADAIMSRKAVSMGTSMDARRAMDLVARVYAADPTWDKRPVAAQAGHAPQPMTTVAVKPSERHVVVHDDVREEQIRSRELFQEYLALAKEEALRSFAPEGRATVPCPACGTVKRRPEFTKATFQYATCAACKTLYANPRPSADALRWYLNESAAGRFWSGAFFPATLEARREKIFRPRIQWLLELAADSGMSTPNLLDVGSGYGVYLDELVNTKAFGRIACAEPRRDVRDAANAFGVTLIEKEAGALRDTDFSPNIVTAFEVLERTVSLPEFFGGVSRILPKNGFFCFTTLSASGFDLQVLWDRAPSIYPPDRLNLLSIQGLERLAERFGFEIYELSTPGQLDASIVADALVQDPTIEVPRFVRTLVEEGGPHGREEFQEFLQTYRLSSHVRAAFRKR